MQEGGHVLVDSHAVRQHLGVEHAGGQAGEAVVELALQQKAYLHAAPGGVAQHAAEQAPGVEIGRDQIDAFACAR